MIIILIVKLILIFSGVRVIHLYLSQLRYDIYDKNINVSGATQPINKPKVQLSLDWKLRLYVTFCIVICFGGCSIPFSTEDISKAIPPTDPADVELPSFLRDTPSAQFLILLPE